jgi:hypothetical protein
MTGAGLVSVNSYLIQDVSLTMTPIRPDLEAGFYYFLAERGRAGLTAQSNQADVKSGTDEAAASFMRAHWPVFGIAYRMLGSASEASEKPAALQSTRGPNMFSSHVPGFGAARPGLGCTQQTALLLGSRGGYMLGHFRSTSNQGGLLCRAVRPSLPPTALFLKCGNKRVDDDDEAF